MCHDNKPWICVYPYVKCQVSVQPKLGLHGSCIPSDTNCAILRCSLRQKPYPYFKQILSVPSLPGIGFDGGLEYLAVRLLLVLKSCILVLPQWSFLRCCDICPNHTHLVEKYYSHLQLRAREVSTFEEAWYLLDVCFSSTY
jgi:hypothetical protein